MRRLAQEPAARSAQAAIGAGSCCVLKITGGYNQASTGTLSPVITGTTPGTKFGQLSVGARPRSRAR